MAGAPKETDRRVGRAAIHEICRRKTRKPRQQQLLQLRAKTVPCATDGSPAVRGPGESLSLVCLPSYCDQLKASESTHVLQPFLPGILDGLIHLAAQFSSEVLSLVLETLCTVCTVDPVFTASAESKVCPFAIAVFLKHSNGTGAAQRPWPAAFS